MANFTCHYGGPLTARLSKDFGFRVIDRVALEAFWSNNEAQRDRHGIYVFAIKKQGPGASIPYYVGVAGKTDFRAETFNSRNRKAFTAALLQSKGTPEIHLASWVSTPGPFPISAMKDLETLFIWIARHRNPALINRQKIDTKPRHLMQLALKNIVYGVLNAGSGKVGENAKLFRAMMGL